MMLSDVCLTSVANIRSAGGVCGRPAGWRVLVDRARFGRPGSRLPLRASAAGLGGGISWRPPTRPQLVTAIITSANEVVFAFVGFCLSGITLGVIQSRFPVTPSGDRRWQS